MFKSVHFERRTTIRKRSFWDALGPFPRSVWIHPHTPEDDLDRICFKIWRRSVWAQRGIWPHLPENAHRFADDPPTKDVAGVYNCATTKHEKRPDCSLPRLAGAKHKLDELMLMVQQEMVQTLDQQHDTRISCQLPFGSLCFRGDDPDDLDKPKEVVNIKEAQRRRIEKFLKDVLITNQNKKKGEVSEGLSLEDFPPLPCTASPGGDRPGQKAHIRKEVSSSMSPLAFKSQAFDDLAGPRPQRNQRRQKRQRLKPLVFSKEAIMEAIQSTQGSKALNEPCSQMPGSCQPEDVTEAAVDDEKMSKKQGRSNLPVFTDLHTSGELMIENLLITGGGGLQHSSSADGAWVAHNPAGADTESRRRAAGPPENAKSHRLQEDTLGPASVKVGLPKGHMARVQVQAYPQKGAEQPRSSRLYPQKVAMPEAWGPGPATSMLAPAHPAPQGLMRLPPGFTQPQMSPQSVAMASLLLNPSLTLPGMGVMLAPPPVHILHPLYMSGDAWKPLLHSDNFRHNVNLQGVNSPGSLRAPHVVPGFTEGDVARGVRRNL